MAGILLARARGGAVWTDERGEEKGRRSRRKSGRQRHSGSDGGGSEPITYYNCLAGERASERAPVKHPSSRRMAPLPITSAVIANFSRSSSLAPASAAYLLPSLPPSLSSFCPCLVARLLDHPQQPTRRQLRLFLHSPILLSSLRTRMDTIDLSLSLSPPFLLLE